MGWLKYKKLPYDHLDTYFLRPRSSSLKSTFKIDSHFSKMVPLLRNFSHNF